MRTLDDKAVTSLYCGRAGRIVPLAEGFCRACDGPAREDDGRHQRVTPRLLKRLGYVSTPLPGAAARGAARRRVLCIDNRASRNLAVFLLKRAGFEVSTAGSVMSATETARGAGFDLYLVNHKLLRGAGGDDLCDRLRAATPHSPILFYSTVTYPFRRREAGSGRGGPAEPVSVTEVAAAVSEALGGRAGVGPAPRATGDARGGGLSTAAKVLAGAAGLAAAALLLGALAQARR
ncbi:MAG TPA: response regulator, partial [Pyrinomonadaceae bacterium]|nr:response regulator [Pyrinomonadaceae bacterium]